MVSTPKRILLAVALLAVGILIGQLYTCSGGGL